jgi:hypothetical protein
MRAASYVPHPPPLPCTSDANFLLIQPIQRLWQKISTASCDDAAGVKITVVWRCGTGTNINTEHGGSRFSRNVCTHRIQDTLLHDYRMIKYKERRTQRLWSSMRHWPRKTEWPKTLNASVSVACLAGWNYKAGAPFRLTPLLFHFFPGIVCFTFHILPLLSILSACISSCPRRQGESAPTPEFNGLSKQ